jgi:hypothetical protein
MEWLSFHLGIEPCDFLFVRRVTACFFNFTGHRFRVVAFPIMLKDGPFKKCKYIISNHVNTGESRLYGLCLSDIPFNPTCRFGKFTLC